MALETILVVDDDLHIGNLLEEILSKAGYRVKRAYSGTEAAGILGEEEPDLVLLDLMLPGLSGEELLPRIDGIPVIVVSAKAGIDSKVDLLLGGAADYITKPFDTKELLARVAVQLRDGPRREKNRLSYNGLTLHTDTHSVFCGDAEVRLTPTEYAILRQLMRNPAQVVTKTQLLDRISLDTPDCTESSLKMHVSNLRRKLRTATGRECVEAVWGIGFKLAEN
ncbi:DNA-binding response regulator [Acutalibacter sp. 1XD8-33]|nr:response regulator transcription factor [Acutalibacter sp. 1XD8-33]RKJ40081.1 DNA-binding response regulator [Acutalibacter sp. 1XD8-33]